MTADASLLKLLVRPVAAVAGRGNAFLEAALFRRPPPLRWTSPNRVLRSDDVCALRAFSAPLAPRLEADAVAGPAVLVVPPEVNQSVVVDFGPGQSLVAALLEAGFGHVAAIEWSTPRPETASRDIDSSIAAILDAIDAVGGRVHLIGICQGGWESAIAAALAPPDKVATLTLVAAPVDFGAGEGIVKQVARATPMAFYRALVALGGGVMRGELISGGFDGLMVFERTWLKHLSLWNHVDDERWLERYFQLNDWYRSPKDLPGRLYLRAVRELFKENRLVQGRFSCLGRVVDLSRITCPLCLIAGRRDHITPPSQVWATRRALSSSEVLEVETDGGHIGAFMGRKELAEAWPKVFNWLHRHDEGAHPTRSARNR